MRVYKAKQKIVPGRLPWNPKIVIGHSPRKVCGYVTTGQYDVALVVEMPNGDAMTKLAVAMLLAVGM
jgi:hypothetical protein